MKRETIVVDAGVGNLGNLVRALRYVGADCRVTTDPQAIGTARCLVLPGVGAFRPPRETLRGPMEDALRQALAGGAWLLGICVGYQLLFEGSDEFGSTDGLGLLPGTIRCLPDTVQVPHIGWNRLHDEQPHPFLDGIPAGSSFYFVHSFAPFETRSAETRSAEMPSTETPATKTLSTETLAQATHGVPFAAIAGRGRVLGTQFHPERSGPAGLQLLSNYLEMAHAGDGSCS